MCSPSDISLLFEVLKFPGLNRSGGEKHELFGVPVLEGVRVRKELELGLYGETLLEDPVPVSKSGLQRSRFTPDVVLLRVIFLRRALFDNGVLATIASAIPLSFFGLLSKETNRKRIISTVSVYFIRLLFKKGKLFFLL